MIALLIMTDGRDTIYETIPSAEANLAGAITERWIHDDSGSTANAAKLRRTFPSYTVISPALRQGFGGAIRNAWATIRSRSRAPYIFHLEDDFTFNRKVALSHLITVLEACPHLVQLALRRQPCNAEELVAGGVVELHPTEYEERTAVPWHGQLAETRQLCWLEHRLFFTTNPSLYRHDLTYEGWPDVKHSEGAFTQQLLADPAVRFGYWGARGDGEWVTHIGRYRNGRGY